MWTADKVTTMASVAGRRYQACHLCFFFLIFFSFSRSFLGHPFWETLPLHFLAEPLQPQATDPYGLSLILPAISRNSQPVRRVCSSLGRTRLSLTFAWYNPSVISRLSRRWPSHRVEPFSGDTRQISERSRKKKKGEISAYKKSKGTQEIAYVLCGQLGP